MRPSRSLKQLFVLVLCSWLLSGLATGQESSHRLMVRLNENGAPLLVISYGTSSRWRCTLERSTTPFPEFRNFTKDPVARISLQANQSSFLDIQAPERSRLYYRLRVDDRDGKPHYSNTVVVIPPLPKVSELQDPWFLVDKKRYTMILYDGVKRVRCFPIALGQNPVRRKLHFDRASTPEGVYRVSGLQPQATFHRAFDINYPNATDKVRYDFYNSADQLPHIGGEIQIHGDGIFENWTWGCVALRNSDMDWLFSRPELDRGLPVYISGSEISTRDLLYLRWMTTSERTFFVSRLEALGYPCDGSEKSLATALCRFQSSLGLPVTAVLDRETRQRLR